MCLHGGVIAGSTHIARRPPERRNGVRYPTIVRPYRGTLLPVTETRKASNFTKERDSLIDRRYCTARLLLHRLRRN